jgi:hypothetical protein
MEVMLRDQFDLKASQLACRDGSKNKFRWDFVLLLPLVSPSLILLPQICREGLGGSIRFPAVRGPRALPAPPLDPSLATVERLVFSG